jgi:hypothetical protein
MSSPENGAPAAPNPLAALLAPRATAEVEGSELHWRVRVLSPVEAAELEAGLAMLRAAAEPGDSPADAVGKMDPKSQVHLVAHLEAVACAACLEGSKSGKSWHPIRLVRTFEEQAPEASPPRIYVGTIPPKDLMLMSFAATRGYREAKAASAGFRPEAAPTSGD